MSSSPNLRRHLGNEETFGIKDGSLLELHSSVWQRCLMKGEQARKPVTSKQ